MAVRRLFGILGYWILDHATIIYSDNFWPVITFSLWGWRRKIWHVEDDVKEMTKYSVGLISFYIVGFDFFNPFNFCIYFLWKAYCCMNVFSSKYIQWLVFVIKIHCIVISFWNKEQRPRVSRKSINIVTLTFVNLKHVNDFQMRFSTDFRFWNLYIFHIRINPELINIRWVNLYSVIHSKFLTDFIIADTLAPCIVQN